MASIQLYIGKEELELMKYFPLSGYFRSHVKFQYIKSGQFPHPTKLLVGILIEQTVSFFCIKWVALSILLALGAHSVSLALGTSEQCSSDSSSESHKCSAAAGLWEVIWQHPGLLCLFSSISEHLTDKWYFAECS